MLYNQVEKIKVKSVPLNRSKKIKKQTNKMFPCLKQTLQNCILFLDKNDSNINNHNELKLNNNGTVLMEKIWFYAR